MAARPGDTAVRSAAGTPVRDESRDLGREVLPEGDGWASQGGGTTGGAAADDAHVFTVRTRAELVRALDGGSDTPKIIKVAGTIDANTDDRGRPLDCADYVTGGYDRAAYLKAYDPRTWGAAKPSGPQEEARAASAARQAERVELAVGSNTTIVGQDSGAVLEGGSLQVENADNVIIRNLEVRDAYDCFPAWQPNTGGLGDWKSAYDTIWLRGATHVWVDHVTASDGDRPDAREPVYFARPYLRYDGLLDITNGADLVTVSWSVFDEHDKAMLIGNGDGVTTDRGKLRVTLHHNRFKSVVQRAPRVRFGQVHLYNNRYDIPDGREGDYRYSIGVSTESRIVAENNAFTAPAHIEVADLVKSWNGTALSRRGNEFNGFPVDLLAIYNAYNSGSERDLVADVGWTPELHGPIDSAREAARDVARQAGAGRLSMSAPSTAVATPVVATGRTADASAATLRHSDRPHGFASLAGGTTGGEGGSVVTVRTQADLARYAAAPEPYVIRIAGAIEVAPFGSDIVVASDKTLVGVGTSGEIVHGELHLNPGTSNVIIRNLTIRDSYVEGNWDGKTTDFDAIQMDSVHHVWIDHNRLTRMGDGLLDIRKDSDYITVSYNRFENHNKALGIGWTENTRTRITIDHNWFLGTKQRNPSADNCAYAHLYNNYLSAQVEDGDPVWTYGNWARGTTKMVIENSYYDGVQHPYQADAEAELVERGSVLKDTTGRHDEWGAAFDPRSFYSYRLDPAQAVPALVRAFSGPQ
ncbi:hypothetical protein ABT367_31290 [Streptomyces mesophilus]